MLITSHILFVFYKDRPAVLYSSHPRKKGALTMSYRFSMMGMRRMYMCEMRMCMVSRAGFP